MLRKATLAIEASNTCMKVAIEITTATSQGFRFPAAERLRLSDCHRLPMLIGRSSDLHGRYYRHSRAHVDIGSTIEDDLHGHALHHFNVLPVAFSGGSRLKGA